MIFAILFSNSQLQANPTATDDLPDPAGPVHTVTSFSTIEII